MTATIPWLLPLAALGCLGMWPAAWPPEGPAARPLGDVPGLETDAPPPAGVKPGLRLTYHRMSGILGGPPRLCRLDRFGRWCGPNGESPGGKGSAGYLQANLVGRSEKEAAIQLVFFLFEGLDSSAPTNKLETGFVAPVGTGGDLWLHPDALKVLLEKGAGELVTRVTKEIEGTRYDAVQIVSMREDGRGVWIYDLGSGILLYSSQLTATLGRFGQPETEVHFNTFQTSRQLSIPWANEPPPPWLANVQRLDYRGQFRVDQSGLPPSGVMPFQLGLEVLRRGTDWLHLRVTTPSDPPSGLTDTNLRVSGSQQLCGLWIPPQGLAKLRAGQTIDSDSLTRVVTSVSHTDGQQVVFRLQNPRQQAELTYRCSDGLLARAIIRESLAVPGMSNVVELQLTGVR
ncbi:MAG: hypothetical protein AB1726_01485 [Planctomycetota bacterium]